MGFYVARVLEVIWVALVCQSGKLKTTTI